MCFTLNICSAIILWRFPFRFVVYSLQIVKNRKKMCLLNRWQPQKAKRELTPELFGNNGAVTKIKIIIGRPHIVRWFFKMHFRFVVFFWRYILEVADYTSIWTRQQVCLVTVKQRPVVHYYFHCACIFNDRQPVVTSVVLTLTLKIRIYVCARSISCIFLWIVSRVRIIKVHYTDNREPS